MASVEYVLGTSQEELERLIWQDRLHACRKSRGSKRFSRLH
jgi:hypothetical protein